MTISILRTNDAWWVQTPTGAAKITTTAVTTGELLADRAAINAAAHGADTVPLDSLELVSPVTAPCRVVAQMTNFASHVKDAGMDPKSIPLTFFRKASGSISGPFDEIVRPEHVRVLDCEVEIGLGHRSRHPRRDHDHRSEAVGLHCRPCRHQRRVGPRYSAPANAVLRG